MPDQEKLSLSNAYFRAIYRLAGSEQQAWEKARDICVEQTVEYPLELITREDIREQILGRVASLTADSDGCYRAVIAFPVEVVGGELTQLLNVLFGNISLKPGIQLIGLEFPDDMLRTMTGPRFGSEGIRDLVGVPERPLLCTALKPMGLSAKELADLAYQFALGGIDLIKDDHGLTNQTFSPFEERVKRCAEAVVNANQKTGGHSLYLANATAPVGALASRIRLAKAVGAGGLVIAPGLIGLDTMRSFAADETVAIPIFSHPALQGSFTVHPEQGISHGVLYGLINRLAGADACIFPNFGGRFSFTAEACRNIVDGARKSLGNIRPIFPIPAGGMGLSRVPELIDFYGKEVILLIGGDLYRRGREIRRNSEHFVHIVEQSVAQRGRLSPNQPQ